MHQLVLLVSDAETRELLEQWIATHPFERMDDDTAKEPIEIHILDSPALASASQVMWTDSGNDEATILPVLQLSPENDPQIDDALPFSVQQRIDDLLDKLQSQQEQLLRIYKAVESTGDAISIADMHGTALYHNKAFIDLYGYTVDELNMYGVPDMLFVNPALAHDIFETVQRDQRWQGEALLRSKKGRIIPSFIRADSILDENQQRIGLVTVYTDITERKRIELLRREQQIMAEALRDTAAALTSTINLEEVLDRILVNIRRVVPHDAAYVLLIEDDGIRIARKRGATGVLSDASSNGDCPVSKTDELEQMILTGKPVIGEYVPDTASGDNQETAHIRSYVGVPILLKKETIGFLYLTSAQPRFFSSSHERYLQVFSEQAAIALHNARVHQQAMLVASLEERQRLARDLHDAVSQTLFSASVIAEALPMLWERNPAMMQERLDQLHRMTRGALAEMRSLLLELRPSALMEARLGELLQQLTDALQGRTKIETTLKVEGERHLPEDVQTALYYIAQEALNNVVKHAHASHVYVRLRNLPHRVELSIRDNGRGFELNDASSTSMGLGIMRERAMDINAEIAIHSQPEKGTLVLVNWVDPEGE